MTKVSIRCASDLHLEGFTGRDPLALAAAFLPNDEADGESILVLAGDISSNPAQLCSFISTVEHRFKKVVFVPGNHCYYRHDYSTWNITIGKLFFETLKNTIWAFDSVHCTEVQGVRFIYGTLWGDGGPTLADQINVGQYLNDFRVIQNGPGKRFTVQDMVAIYKAQKAQIVKYLADPYAGKTVVVTHHMPSRRLVSKRFWPADGSDGANGGFVGDCDDIMAYGNAPDLWIHGHTHSKIDTMLWNTRVVCNPTGYRTEWGFSDIGNNRTFIDV